MATPTTTKRTKPAMNWRLRERWISSLRLGGYAMRRGGLRHGGTFSALGVLADVVVTDRRGWRWSMPAGDPMDLECWLESEDGAASVVGYLPPKFLADVGLGAADARRLEKFAATLPESANRQLADWIEDNVPVVPED